MLEKTGQFLRRHDTELFILSSVSIFAELLTIRWMSGDIRALTVFRTFPLLTCFVGLGMGFVSSKAEELFKAPYWLFLFVLIMEVADFTSIAAFGFPSDSIFQWQNLAFGSTDKWSLVLLMMLSLILLLAGPLAFCFSVGSRLGARFSELPPLKAYSLNLLGAILGSVAFAVCSFAGWAPCFQLIPLSVILAYYLKVPTNKHKLLGVILLTIAPFLAALPSVSSQVHLRPQVLTLCETHHSTAWSPYQRLDFSLFTRKSANSGQEKVLGLELGANRAFYQFYWDADTDLQGLPDSLAAYIKGEREAHGLPFSIGKKIGDVLVVGAGTGHDVALAIKKGAEHVDAVELDPDIMAKGKEINPYYHSPKVTLICDDARHFFAHTNNRYDIIYFAFLDSHSVVGEGSAVRLDAYVYTQQSIEEALHLLKPGGLICMNFISMKPWIADKLFYTLKETAGYEPIVLGEVGSGMVTFFLGDAVKDGSLNIKKLIKKTDVPSMNSSRILTDDWPYLYVRPEIIDVPFYLTLLEIVLIAVFVSRKLLFTTKGADYWQMFFLGAAFMLMELQAMARLSLLFGSTWLTAAIVINGILVLLWLANILLMKVDTLLRHQSAWYVALFCSLLISYFLPVSVLLSSNSPFYSVAYPLITILTLLPFFMAGFIFPSALTRVSAPSKGMAINLLGSVLGGLLEYLSSYVGIRALVLVGLALYAWSFTLYLKSTKVIH